MFPVLGGVEELADVLDHAARPWAARSALEVAVAPPGCTAVERIWT